MRELNGIYRIVQDEILRVTTQFYVKDTYTGQPIIISFEKVEINEDSSSSLVVKYGNENENDDKERIIPYIDEKYGGSCKIENSNHIFTIKAIDSYLDKFLMYHLMCDAICSGVDDMDLDKYREDIMISHSNSYKLFILGSEISGIIDLMFISRVRKQIANLNCTCLVFDECSSENGIFTINEHNELFIQITNETISLAIDPKSLLPIGITLNREKSYLIDMMEPIGLFLINCMILSSLMNVCAYPDIRNSLHSLIDFAIPIVNDPSKFIDNLPIMDNFYLEVSNIREMLLQN